MAETVSNGGNLLVNVGPTKEGFIPAIMQERLHQMGDFLAVNGEAVSFILYIKVIELAFSVRLTLAVSDPQIERISCKGYDPIDRPSRRNDRTPHAGKPTLESN